MFEIITPASYWFLTGLWLAIFVLFVRKLTQSKNKDTAITVLLFILAIDAFRTVFESAYFGLYFNSLFEILPKGIYEFLAQPQFLIIPKLLNIVAGLLILFLLIRLWLPRELEQRETIISNLEQAKLTAIKEKEEAEKQASMFQSMFNGIPDGIIFTDHDRRIVLANEGMKTTFGYTIDDLAGKKTSILYESEEEFERQGRIRFNMTAQEKRDPYEVNYRRKDGHVFVGETFGTAAHASDGSLLGFLGVMRDVTERKQSEEKLNLAASVFTYAREGIIITDASGNIIEVNDTFSQITGYSRQEVVGKNPRILQSGRHDAHFFKSLWQSLTQKKHWYGEIWNQRKNGELFAELLTISAVCDANDEVTHYVALFTDITRMKEHEQQLEYIAHYDALTGLPNRVLLADRLRHAMVQSNRRKLSIAVAYLDLDGFKAINDQHGHGVGDQLLVVLTKRMQEALRQVDTLSRLGGDEFIAVLMDLKNMEDYQPVLLRLLQAAAEPVAIGNMTLKVTASIGVTFYPQDDVVDADQLMRHADQAMYTAKQAGKNRYHIFDVDLDVAIQNQQESLDNIELALKNQEFVLYYQPKVNMMSGEVIGAEALIRWQHPEQGLLAPADFLPIIENHRVSIEMGNWVIESALKQISEWHNAGLLIPVSVNIGALQLQQKNFATTLSAILSAHPDVEPRWLELEILETSALSELNEVSTIMHQCLDLGVSFSLDDFGTGFSSLTYLKRLPAGFLKIDQSFVRDMMEDPDDRVIVEGVIGLAKAFNRNVIAEGVETVAHGSRLLGMGCELAQGYGIARPMPPQQIPEWVRNWKPDPSWTESQCIKDNDSQEN